MTQCQCKSRAAAWMLSVGFGVALLQVLALLPTPVCRAAEPTAVYPGVTRPSEHRILAFSYPGVVREVMVKKGERVRQGQALLKLDDRIEQSQLEALNLEANSTLRVDYARKELEQKRVELRRKEQLYAKAAGSQAELEEAQLAAELAQTRLALSEEELALKKIEAARQAIKVELAQLTSTIDGIVQRIEVKEGEFADPNESDRPAIVVVRNDPLEVEVFLPVSATARLTQGQELEVAYPNEQKWRKARITFFDPVADAASGMRKLHLELPNSENRESGWQVKVRVPAETDQL